MEEIKRKINFRLITALLFIVTVATLAHILLEKETGGYFYWSLDYGWEEKRLHLFVLLAEIHYVLCLYSAWRVSLRLIKLTESSKSFKLSESDDEEEPANAVVMWVYWIFSSLLVPIIAGFYDEELDVGSAIWACVSICFFILITPQQFFHLHAAHIDPKTAIPWSKKRRSIDLFYYSPKGGDKAEWAQKAAAKYVKNSKEEFDEKQSFSKKVAIPES